MRILHFATFDIAGGAAKASYRLHSALRDAGHSSQMLVRYKETDDKDVQPVPVRACWRSRFTRVKRYMPFFRRPTATYMFNFDTEPPVDRQFFYKHQPVDVDIICLHWITGLLTAKHPILLSSLQAYNYLKLKILNSWGII